MLGNQLKKLSTSSLAGLQTQAFNSSPYLHTLSMQRETFSGEHDAGLVSFFYFLTEAQLIYSISGIQQSDSVIYNICIHVYFFRFFFHWASLVAQMQRICLNVGDLGWNPGLGQSPGGEHGNPLQYSWLENPHGQRSLVGCSPWGHRVRHDWVTKHCTYIYFFRFFSIVGWQDTEYNFVSYTIGPCSLSVLYILVCLW